jgi:2-polyprenyl-6-methoxyphenol hydroxylase-like FAD-dependent oxidoreductase
VKTEVLIVGAGPVGLTLAAELARYGVSVRVIDKAAQRSELSKALVVWSRTLELLDRSGCGAAFVEAGLKVTAANIVAERKTIGRIELGSVSTPHPYALMLPQSETERLLEEHLLRLGVAVERNVELASFAEGKTGVQCVLRHADGSVENVESTWLAGCDGAHSTVRHGLRMVFTGDTQPSSWMLADVELKGVREPGEIQVGWHADGVLAIFPICAERYRVIADAGPSQEGSAMREIRLQEVQAVLDQRGPGGITASDPRWLSVFHINERKVAEYRAGRVFLAGDAAHVHSPAGGQGMNTGMQDVFNLAWKLALVAKGTCAAGLLLESYSAERSEVGDRVLKNAGRLTSMAILRGEVKQSIRNHIASIVFGFAPIRHAIADAMTELSIDYPESPLNGKSRHFLEHPAQGERAPIGPGDEPFGGGTAPKFALCADLSEGKAKHSADVLIGLYPDLLEDRIRPPFSRGGVWLVRPDGYVAVATDADHWDEVAGALERVTGVSAG